MKVTNTPANYINQSYANPPAQGTAQNAKQAVSGEEKTALPSDSINLSSETQVLQKISKANETTSVERQKYVADIKQQVETNQYTVNADKVAERMAGSLLDDFI